MSATTNFEAAERRPSIAILGVPFDNITKLEAIALIEQMIASRKPHYLVTPNVDFLVRARRDVELRRILFEAHLVLCDGTPLVWASRLLGNPLPERVAGSDVVPLLIQVAADKGYRLFLLGASSESGRLAVKRLKDRYPNLVIAGQYSPPYNQLLEMDHEGIREQIRTAKPDLLLVSLGCPKQEKWVAMHYRNLEVPVTIGVGATIDFLAGQLKRAPVWMQRTGTEWMFRLAQEPRRLFGRYVSDLWGFGSNFLPQWWQLRARPWELLRNDAGRERQIPIIDAETDSCLVRVSGRLDFAAVQQNGPLADHIIAQERDCVLNLQSIEFIDSTGVGFLIRMRKRLKTLGCELVLLAPSRPVMRALRLMRLVDFFQIAFDQAMTRRLLQECKAQTRKPSVIETDAHHMFRWRGEITAANAETVWEQTRSYLLEAIADGEKIIDLSEVRFIDSTGLGLMIRAKKLSGQQGESLRFRGARPLVLEVIRLSRLEEYLFGVGGAQTSRLAAAG